MNYGRIAEVIALGLMAVCAVGVPVCVVALWVIGAPLAVSIGVTVLMLAVAVMIFCAVMDSR